MSKYFKMYANCVLSKGANESIICDLQRSKVFNIPNLLHEILIFNEKNLISFEDLLSKYSQYVEGLKKYATLLVSEELAFFTNEPNNFPSIDWTFSRPSLLSSAIINVKDDERTEMVLSLLEELVQKLSCKALELRFVGGSNDLCTITTILNSIKNSRVVSINLLIKYHNSIQEEDFVTLIRSCKAIFKVLVYESPFDYVYDSKDDRELENRLFYSVTGIESSFKIDPAFNFVPTIDIYSESRNLNVGLNSKVFIDEEFNILNYPNHTRILGKYSPGKLLQSIFNAQDLFLWSIAKNKINVCKDCKYHPICVDFCEIEQVSESYVRKVRCNYSPYEDKFDE